MPNKKYFLFAQSRNAQKFVLIRGQKKKNQWTFYEIRSKDLSLLNIMPIFAFTLLPIDRCKKINIKIQIIRFMKKKWKEAQLEHIYSGTSIFQYIPASIGKVVYCDTTEPDGKPMSPDEIKKSRIAFSILAIVSLPLIWMFLRSYIILALLLTMGVLFLCFVAFFAPYLGTDYFVGENGYAIVEFKKKRDNIVEEVVLFDDISYIFSGETIRKEYEENYSEYRGVPLSNVSLVSLAKGKQYVETKYFFRIYGNDRFNEFPLLYERNGTYSDEFPDDPMSPKGVNVEYSLMKVVEERWTSLFCEAHQNDVQVGFAILKKGQIQRDAIIMSPDYFIVEGTTFDHSNMNQISIDLDDDCLVIEGFQQSKWKDVPDEYKKRKIPLSQVGNRKAFLKFYEKFYS